MPDLTIEYRKMCEQMEHKETTIGGYKQSFDVFYGKHCTCPSFKFSKAGSRTCKHIREAEKNICHWHEAYSEERQTVPGVCPVCGGKTITVRVGV